MDDSKVPQPGPDAAPDVPGDVDDVPPPEDPWLDQVIVPIHDSYDDFEEIIDEPLAAVPTPGAEDEAQGFLQKSQDEYLAERRGQVLKAVQHDFELRKEYVPKLYNFVKNWLIFVAIILIIASIPPVRWKSDHTQWHLDLEVSDTVMVALLVQTTATVVGLFVVVARWLFPKRDESGR